MAHSKEVQKLSEDQQYLFEVLNKESDLACVLIAASYMEKCLEQILKEYFIGGSKTVSNILNYKGVLGTLSAKLNVAYALGLVSKELKSDLEEIMGIRNDFAHSHLSLNFEDDNIRQKVEKLVYLKELDREEELKHPKDGVSFGQYEVTKGHTRDRFNLTVTRMSNHLIMHAFSLEHREHGEAYLSELYKNRRKSTK